MNRKLILACCLFLFGLISSNAQTALHHIPSDITGVFSIHPDAIDKKVSLDKVKQMEFYEMMLQEASKALSPSAREDLYKVLKNPGNYGMDMKSGSYFFFKADGSNSYMNYIFRLSDASKFRQVFDQHINMGGFMKVEKTNGYQMVEAAPGTMMAWSNDVFLVSMVEIKEKVEPFSFEDIEVEEPYGEEKEEAEGEEEAIEEQSAQQERKESAEKAALRAEKKKAAIGKWVANVMNLPVASSLATNPQHIGLTQGSNDMVGWMNYEEVMKLYMESMTDNPMMKEVPYMGMFFSQMNDLYKDNFWAMKFNFDKGAFRMDSDMAMNAKMTEMSKALTTSRVNKKFARYIKNNNLIGYYALSFDVEKMVDFYKSLMLDAVKDMPMVGTMAVDAMDIIGIAIDEEALYNLFKGDMVLAFTGLREFEKMITTYEYDDEFNATEVQKPSKQTLPEFTMMMSYGNQQDIMKFIRLGLHASVIEQEGSHFKIQIPGAPMDVYMALENGILFISNNTDLIRHRLKSGYARKERLSKRHCKMLQKHPFVFYWDVLNTLQAAAELKPDAGQMINSNPSPISEVLMTADQVNSNVTHSDLDIMLVDKDKNSLEVMLNFVQEIMPALIGLTTSM